MEIKQLMSFIVYINKLTKKNVKKLNFDVNYLRKNESTNSWNNILWYVLCGHMHGHFQLTEEIDLNDIFI